MQVYTHLIPREGRRAVDSLDTHESASLAHEIRYNPTGKWRVSCIVVDTPCVRARSPSFCAGFPLRLRHSRPSPRSCPRLSAPHLSGPSPSLTLSPEGEREEISGRVVRTVDGDTVWRAAAGRDREGAVHRGSTRRRCASSDARGGAGRARGHRDQPRPRRRSGVQLEPTSSFATATGDSWPTSGSGAPTAGRSW